MPLTALHAAVDRHIHKTRFLFEESKKIQYREIQMDAVVIPDKEALGKCAWCRKRIHDNREVFGFGAKIKKEANFSEYEGNAIRLMLLSEDRGVPMMVTTEGSEAKKNGNDVMFMVCSEKCGKEMKTALKREKSVGDVFAGIHYFGGKAL